jgi:hypothetical protein
MFQLEDIGNSLVLVETSVKYFDHRPPQRWQRRASDASDEPATPATDPNSSDGKKFYR